MRTVESCPMPSIGERNATDSDVIRKLAGRAGVPVAKVDETRIVHDHRVGIFELLLGKGVEPRQPVHRSNG